MKRVLVFLSLPLVFLAACSVVNLVPQPGGSTQLSADGMSLIARQGGVAVSASLQDTQVPSQRMVENLCSFQVVIDNGTSTEYRLPLESFVLIDDQGHQYNAMAPTTVSEFVKKDSELLIPYPYVGYYYSEDVAKAGSQNALQSSLPFYAENHPQDIFTQALPQEPIIPGAKISGLVYFVADLASMKSVELRVYPADTGLNSPPQFRFAFSVEKK